MHICYRYFSQYVDRLNQCTRQWNKGHCICNVMCTYKSCGCTDAHTRYGVKGVVYLQDKTGLVAQPPPNESHHDSVIFSTGEKPFNMYTVLGTSNTKLFCKFVKALHFTSILYVHSSMCDHVCMLNIIRRPPPSGRVQCDSVSLLWPVHHQLAGSCESESEGRVIPCTWLLSQDGAAELCHCGASPADILLTAYTQERGL